MSGAEIDPLLWAVSLGLTEIVRDFPEDAIAAYRDARRDLDDLRGEQIPKLDVPVSEENPK
jgi:hypothetical protein